MSTQSRVNVDVTKVDYLKDWDNENQAPTHLIGRTAGGSRVHLVNDEVRPYFYVPLEQYGQSLENSDMVTKVEYGYESIYGEDMVKIYTRVPGDVPRLRNNTNHHEADILFPNRFLIDTGIEGAISIPAEHATNEPTQIQLSDIEPATENIPSRVAFCDIEVDDSNGFPSEDVAEEEIICLTVYDNYTEEYHLFFYHPDTPIVEDERAHIHIFDNELSMLRSFVKWLMDTQPDVLAGWNFSDFDARYLLNRLERLADEMELDDFGQHSMSTLGVAYDDGYFGGKIKGIAVFDMLRAYKNLQFSELDSYRLEDVAQEELGTGKVKDSRSIYEQWMEEPELLAKYNITDVELTVRLEEEQGIIQFYEEIANFVGGRLSEVIGVHKAVDIKVLRAVQGEWVVPSAQNVEGEKFEGAKVFDPITGVRENVIVLDLASLYPMSMKTINAGPDTKVAEPGPNAITAPNGVSFTKEKDAIVVEMIDEMLEEREKYKRLRNKCRAGSKQYDIFDRKQAAVKVVMNTLYGVMGWDRFRLKDQDVGSAVTATGRAVIEHTKEVAENMGYEVIYGDTDSVMIELGPDISVEQAKEIGFELEERINEAYDEFAEEELGVDEHFFDIEFEKLYRRYFQSGRKKRYAGHIVWKEGKERDDVDIVGFEFKRSDYATIPKQIQEYVLDKIVRGGTFDEISEYVRDKVGNIRAGEYDLDEIGIPGSISKSFEDYDSPTMHVRGAKYAIENYEANIQPGDKPKGLYVKRILPGDDGQPEYPMPAAGTNLTPFTCWMNTERVPDTFEWDWDEYVNVQIERPLRRIFEGTDWTWEEVISGNIQPGLSQFDRYEEDADDDSTFRVGPEKEDDIVVDPEDLDHWERKKREAKKRLSNTQQFLEGFDPDEVNEDGPDEKVSFVQKKKDRENLFAYLD